LSCFFVVDAKNVDTRENLPQQLRLAVDPEIHRIGKDKLWFFHLVEYLQLQCGVYVREQNETTASVARRELGMKAGEHVELCF
jgi:hypothetical protein